MTNSEQIEEILTEAHAYNKRLEVMTLYMEYKKLLPKMDDVTLYQRAFNELCIGTVNNYKPKE